MKHLSIASIFAIAATSAAFAQDPAPKPDPNAAHPPTGRMEQVTPTMKAPDGQQQHPPTNRVGETVPPMKSTDQQSADTGTTTGAFFASEEWIGRSVYSSDGKQLGKVASFKKDGELFVDIGGFLGLGETRTLIKSDQIQGVTEDRIVLRLSEAEAKKLPAAEEEKPAQQ
jgi:hypothetical protein